MELNNFYYNLEDKWYSLVDKVDSVIPISTTIDKIDEYVPSFILFLSIIILLIILLAIQFIPNTQEGRNFEILVLNSNNLPLKNAEVIVDAGCTQEQLNLKTNKEGKVTTQVCLEEINVLAKKEGYQDKSKDFYPYEKAILKLSMPTQEERYLTIIVEENQKTITEANIEVICDEKREEHTNQTNTGFFIQIPPTCGFLQIKASAEGYEDKTINLDTFEERKIIELTEIQTKGKIIFSVKTNQNPISGAEVAITNNLGNTKTLYTNNFGEIKEELDQGSYEYIVNKDGEFEEGEFDLIAGETENISVNLTAPTQEVKPYIALEITNQNEKISMAEILLHRDGKYFGKLRTNLKGKTTNKYISNTNKDSQYTGVIISPGYEIKTINLQIITTGFQQVNLEKNNSKLIINVFDDQNKTQANATVGIKSNNLSGLVNQQFTDSNGTTTLNDLPIGNFTIFAHDKQKNDEITKQINLPKNTQREINLYLNTGKGKIKIDFLNPTYEDTNPQFTLDNTQQTPRRGSFTSEYFKTNSKIELEINDSNYYPLKDIEYLIQRGTIQKEIFARKIGNLPNNKKTHMFLRRVYKVNPKYSSNVKNNSVTKLLPKNTYYFLFENIVDSDELGTFFANFVIGDKNNEEIKLNEKVWINGVYSISNAREILSNKYLGEGIDITNNEILVNEHAKQANVSINNMRKSSIPIILEITIDENAEGILKINYNSRHAENESFEYSKEITIGESFCIDDCPDFFFDNYLIRNETNQEIITEDSYLYLEDNYKLKTKVINNSDNHFGPISLINSISKTKQRYLLFENDINSIENNITLGPFQTSNPKINSLDLKKRGLATIFQRVEKIQEGIDILASNPGNNQSVSLRIKNKKQLAIDVSSRTIHAGTYYPMKTIRTRYNTTNTGIPAYWHIEINDQQIKSGRTDENGIEFIDFDARNLNAGDTVKFVTYDNQDSIKAEQEIIVTSPFTTQEEPDECLKIKLDNTNYIPTQTFKTLNKNENTTLKIISNCDVNRTIKLFSDLTLSQITFTINPKEEQNITITATPRGNLLGVYPVQVFANNKSRVKEIAHLDIIIKDPDSCFDLEQAIFDFRTTGKISSKVTNKCFQGRQDNFYPQMNLSTGRVSLDYKKPGLPRDMNIAIKIRGSAIESHVNGLVKSEGFKIYSSCDRDWGRNSKTKYTSKIPDFLFATDQMRDMCDDATREYTANPRPEPEREENQLPQKEHWVPSDIASESEISIQTKEKQINKLSFSESVSTNYLKDYYPTTDDTGEWVWSTMPLSDPPKITINSSPLRVNNAYQLLWDKFHDHAGNVTEPAGGVNPEGFKETFITKGQLYVNEDPMWKYAPFSTFDDNIKTYYKFGSVARNPKVFWGGQPIASEDNNIDKHANAIYFYGYAKSSNCGNWFRNPDHSSMEIQIDQIAVVEFLIEQRNQTTLEATIRPIEGKVYNIGSYNDATPVPQWTNIKERDGYKSGDKYTINQSQFQVACIINNGFVDPVYASYLGHQFADSYNGMPMAISAPDAALDSVEYSNDGYIWYYTWPWEYDSENLKVYLENGNVFVEYVGVPEIPGNNIDFNLGKNNLTGNEYAILEVGDWTGGNTKENTAFQIKLTGNEHNCYSEDGVSGITGRDFNPRLLFDWKWERINIDQCDSDNSSYTYCDSTQFTISLFKKIKEIDELLKNGHVQRIPEKTAFYSYLIKDTYTQNFLNDFENYHSNNLAATNPEFANKYFKYITENKLTIDSNIMYGGLYRIEIDIDRIENISSLFDGEEIISQLNIKITPVHKATNYNLFYEMPFDGHIGKENRNGYGSGFSENIKVNNNLEVSNSNNALNYYTVRSTKNLDLLNKGIVLDLKNNSLLIAPSQPNPITMTISSDNGKANIGHTIDGEFSDTLTHKKWNMINSTIGGRKCVDFEGKENLTFDIEKNNSNQFIKTWNGTRDGQITLGTVMFTPKSSGGTPLKINPILKTTMNGYSYLKNSESYMLNNYENENIKFEDIQTILQKINQEKMCISNGNQMQIFWNPDHLQELIQEINTNNGSRCFR